MNQNIVQRKKQNRIQSIDLLRGLIIVIMALDHTRAFWGKTAFEPTDLTQADASWFFTRWITHFCAPLFVFLSGISAYLYYQKCQSKTQLRNFLLTRGLWIIFLEITIINFSWQFAYYAIFVQVLWVIGWSMIILALLIYLPRTWILGISLIVIGLHNAIDDSWMTELFGENAWKLLHVQGWIPISAQNFGVFVMYPLIPWFAVMSLGYILGDLYLLNYQRRKQYLVLFGAFCILLFSLLRLVIDYGDPFVWTYSVKNSFLELFNTSKYPPSLQFLLMTIGPGLIVLALLEKYQSKFEEHKLYQWILTIGKVPMFFYLLHVPFINFSAQIYTWLKFDRAVNFNLVPPNSWPQEYSPNLLVVYLVWVAIVFVLYFPCRKYSRFKQQNKNPWLSYI
ncbi:DUF1624 domain-containing protein [Aliikangiella sp. G2MR2-5]|uniref:DUF1624 domain-containing protein n=1 Tax=Aliikangiella sp. G2MR2-5 TaxID=2788943 RepID=UPI0018AC5837|nr:heparan-alpha-glucosaminide N-acetyltransferase domain-containing protein [Aliikangiella sp. G2MR2-5]